MRIWVTLGVVAALISGVYFGANYLTAYLIATRLPAALTVDEGSPVTISNVRANIWALRAYADELIYGPESRPFAVVSNVAIELDATNLLSGVIHLATASGTEADFWPGRVPTVETRPGDTDLAAIEAWLPDVLAFDSLDVLVEDELVYAAQNVVWRRLDEHGRIISWQRRRGSDLVRLEARTPDLDAVLAGQSADVVLRMFETAGDEVILAAHILAEPAEEGVRTRINVESEGLLATLSYVSEDLLTMPASSSLEVKNLAAEELTVVASLLDTGVQVATEGDEELDLVKARLPVINLPRHRMQVRVEEMGLDDEVVRNVTADVQMYPAGETQAARLEVRDLTARLPRANLAGTLDASLGETWEAAVDLKLLTPSREPEHRGLFLSSDWLWESGQLDVVTTGTNLAELIDNSRGQLDVSGVYRAHVELPVTVKARFDERRGRFGAEQLQLTIGDSEIGGTVWIEEDQQDIYVRLHTPTFDVRQFLPPPPPDEPPLPGVGLPDFAWWSSELEIDARLTGDRIYLPGVTLTGVDASLLRRPGGEQLKALFVTEGLGTFRSHGYTRRTGQRREVDLRVSASELDPRSLGADLPGKVSGSLRLQGGGEGFAELVGDLTSTLEAEIDFDATQGVLKLRSAPKLLLADERIVGVDLAGLSLSQGEVPLTSGRLRYDVRGPELSGELTSTHFDADVLLSTLPATLDREGEGVAAAAPGAVEEIALAVMEQRGADEGPADPVALLASLPNLKLTLSTDTLTILATDLHGFAVDLEAAAGSLKLANLQFHGDVGVLKADAQALMSDGAIDAELNGSLGSVALGTLLDQRALPQIENPLDGTVSLATSGRDWDSFAANLRGGVKLSDGDAGNLTIDVDFQQRGQGIGVTVNELRYGASDLRGEIGYEPAPLRRVSVDLASDFIDLKPFEGALEADADAEGLDEIVEEAASLGANSARLIENVLRLPFDLFAGSGDAEGDRYFSPEPYPVELLRNLDLDTKLKLAEVRGSAGVIRNLAAFSEVKDDRLSLRITADEINGARARLDFDFDATTEVPTGSVNSELLGFRPGNDPANAPRSIFMAVTGTGDSEAALLGSLNGEVYVEAGAGNTDLAEMGLGFFTDDLLGRVSRVLIPQRAEVPKLNCAVAFGQAKDGVLTTPKAMIMQTRQANVLLRAEINLKEETVAAQFDSRSRSGAGVSVGNVFSNTVRVRGPLSSPGLVPNTTGILWRGWAALATGGLSLLGESFVKRVLASDQACDHVRRDIQDLICEGPTPAARSTLVCPAAA